MRNRVFASILATTVAATSVSFTLTGPVVPSAFAQGLDADTKEAKSLFEEGVKLYKVGKYEEARVKFKAAYGLKKRPSIVLNLANAEMQTKRSMEAIAHFKELMAMPDAKQDDKDEAKAGLEQAKKQVGVIVVDAPTGSTVTIDGESKQVPVDGEFYVAPGMHTVVLKVGGKETVEKPNLIPGGVFTVKAGAETSPVTAPATTTTPPATTPPETTPPTTTPPETTPPPAAQPPTSDVGAKQGPFEGVHPVTYVAAGVTVVAAIGWVAFYFNAKTHDDNAQKLADAIARPTCGPGVVGACTSASNKTLYRQQGKDELSSADSARTLSLVSGIVAGVAAAATVVTYVVLRKKPEGKVALVGAPTWGGATVSLVGQF